MITSSLIHAIKGRLVQNLDPLSVILFGGLAKNPREACEKIEMLVVVNDSHVLSPVRPMNRISIVLELFRHRSFGMDVLVMTEREIQSLRQKNEGEWNLILEIMEEGKVLYDRAREVPHY
ncbi:MAG: hypothetical protein IT308_05585 [Anaerolineaceae bacterium]|nr:hypothetical protein [Anaerolineaceae bacterium]